MGKLAVIRVKGQVGLESGIKDTLSMLGLYRKNYCIVRDDTPSLRGMVRKVKDYVAWGELDAEPAGFGGRFVRLSYTKALTTGHKMDILRHFQGKDK
ncbi:uL30 family ribosomal protein [Candidatus Woesearchaeota archaeon]|nr:uL30 family ribosomal protein [Candidatus Woesearchaeota archaeon]